MRNKFILIITYFFSLIMIALSVLAIYVSFAFKSMNKRTSIELNIGEITQISMADYRRNTNKIVITDKQGIKSVVCLMSEVEKTLVIFSARKTLTFKGTNGEESFLVYNDCLRGRKGEYICNVNIEKFITDVYGKQ